MCRREAGGAASGQMPNGSQVPTNGHLVHNFLPTCRTTQPSISSMFSVESAHIDGLRFWLVTCSIQTREFD
jgi:hypothetical protein